MVNPPGVLHTAITRTMNEIKLDTGLIVTTKMVKNKSPDITNLSSIANIRSWQNQLKLEIKAHLIICISETFNSILFTLNNMTSGMSAYIKLPPLITAGFVSLVYLYWINFEKVYFIKEGALYIYAEKFIGKKNGYDFYDCDNKKSIISQECIQCEQFRTLYDILLRYV